MAYKPYLSIILTGIMLSPASLLAQTPAAAPSGSTNAASMWFHKMSDPFKWKEMDPIVRGNSTRLESLMRGGIIYLSLQDTIALALENNLDIELQRYGPRISESDYRRALAGGSARTINGGVNNASTSGAVSGTGITGANLGTAQQTAITTGSVLGSLDPIFQSTLSFNHRTTPQTSLFVTGTNSLITNSKVANFSVSQNFLTGTSAAFSLNNNFLFQNSGRNDFNPSRTVTGDLQVTQHLLAGFGLAVNKRNIRIAKNNISVSELVFKQQVITTVSSVVNIYWDLVSFNEDLRVKRQALQLNQKLYDDNKKQVEIGTLAPIEIIRAEAEVARSQQDLTISETNVLQQETVLKSSLSRTGVASPGLSEARIIPTDKINLNDSEAMAVQDLVGKAMESRPEIEQQKLNIINSQIGLAGTKNALKPTLDAFFDLRNNSLAGDLNNVPIPPIAGATSQVPIVRQPGTVDPFFLGGYTTAFRQMLFRNFPDYVAGVTLNIPIRNRAAKEDMVRDQLSLRQSEIRMQQQLNQVRVEVQNALIGLQQARARYQTATKNRVLQEQTLDAEQKKYALGASTIFFVIQSQRDLTAAQAAEVAALSTYARAKVEIERSTGQTLIANKVEIQEAIKGVVSQLPNALPPEAK